MGTLKHFDDFLILVSPTLPRRLIEISQIETVSHPNAHFIGRSDRDGDEAAKLCLGYALLAKSLGDIGRYGFGRAPHLIGERALLDRRKLQALTVDLQRNAVSSLRNVEFFERSNELIRSTNLMPDY